MPFEATKSDFESSLERIREIHPQTPLGYSAYLSEKYRVPIYLKYENQEPIGSYKWRGSGNMMAQLDEQARKVGVICSSAGNHAQGVALSGAKLGINATIVMPLTAPSSKVEKTKKLGTERVEVILHGDTYDEAYEFAQKRKTERGQIFIHPFDHRDVVLGQATIALEIFQQMQNSQHDVGMILAANGGGGMIAGIQSAVKAYEKKIEVIGVEPENAASMTAALKAGKPVKVKINNTIADGAKVGQVGQIGFEVVRDNRIRILKSPEGRLCGTIMEMHQNYIILEGAGALGIDGLQSLTQQDLVKLKEENKAIVVVLGGGNIDVGAYHGIVEKSLRYNGVKKDYIITFPQRPGALAEFTALLVPLGINISRFHYDEKAASIDAPVQVTLDTHSPATFSELEKSMKKMGFSFTNITNNYSINSN